MSMRDQLRHALFGAPHHVSSVIVRPPAQGGKNNGHCCIAVTVAATVLMSPAETLNKKKTYELPDGNIISVGDEHFRCPKVPFQPWFIGKKTSEIYESSFLRR